MALKIDKPESPSIAGIVMLKITPIRTANRFKVQLCGKLTKEYVPEIERLLAAEAAGSDGLSIDLANVTFVDREAMMFLCSTKSRSIAVENCPSYVIRWIEQEGLCGNSGPESPGNTSNK